MATLTETAYTARQVIKYGSLGFLGLIVLWFTGSGIINWWKLTHPEPPPPPTMDFGQLKAIIFPASTVQNLEYELLTPDGTAGNFPDRMKVFFVPEKKSSFSDTKKATELAQQLDFLFEPTVINKTTYRWTRTDPLPSSLEVDVITQNFYLKRQWQADPTLVTNKKFNSDKQVVMDAQSEVRRAQLLATDLVGNEKVSYLRAQGSQLIPAISLSEADFVRVDFFRKNIEEKGANNKVLSSYAFYPLKADQGLAWVILAGVAEQKRKLMEFDYHYYPIEYETFGTYPIKTAQTAFEELKGGKGYVAAFEGSGKGTVRRVALGYIDSADNRYTMPVYIFTGDNGLVAYVSAIKDEAIQAK